MLHPPGTGGQRPQCDQFKYTYLVLSTVSTEAKPDHMYRRFCRFCPAGREKIQLDSGDVFMTHSNLRREAHQGTLPIVAEDGGSEQGLASGNCG